MWVIYRQLDWYVISLQPVTALFFQVFSPGGGKPPFVLEVLPVSVVYRLPPWIHAFFQVQGTQRVYNISAAAFNNGVGSYSIVLQLAQEQQFLVTMSDATGFATGGTSPLLTVQAQTADSSDCNTVDPTPQFVYSLEFALQQCR